MATRSRIGILNEDGTITSVYCHWDGYPAHNGRILKNHYSTETLIRELLSFGDLSSLDIRISPTGETHTFKDPEEGCCVYYQRDRGESDCGPDTVNSLDEFFSSADGCDYVYLFEANEWLCAKTYGDKGFKPVGEIYESWS